VFCLANLIVWCSKVNCVRETKIHTKKFQNHVASLSHKKFYYLNGKYDESSALSILNFVVNGVKNKICQKSKLVITLQKRFSLNVRNVAKIVSMRSG
jgi:hypothetical protein